MKCFRILHLAKYVLAAFLFTSVMPGTISFVSQVQAAENSASLLLLNPHEHPPRGTLWTIRFQTTGKADLSILPADQNTQEDMAFESLTCNGELRDPIVVQKNTVVATDYACSGVSEVSYRVLEEGTHAMKIQYGSHTSYAHNATGDFQFAKRLGGESGDLGNAVAVDADGNIIIAGTVNGDADLNGDGDSSDGGAEDATGYGDGDIVFSVFDSSGNFQFAKRLGGTLDDYGNAVAVDTDGNIIIAGTVNGDADLNGDGDSSDGGAEDATDYGSRDIFFSVFDSSGNFQFAKRLGTIFSDHGEGVAVDSNGNIVITGYLTSGNGSVNADLNGDGDSTDGGAESGTGYSSNDIVFSVFDSSGVFQFAKRLGGTSGDRAFAVTTGSNDDIIVGGFVGGDADLNGDGDSSDGGAEDGDGHGGLDAVFSVFDSSGNFRFAKRLGGVSNDSVNAVVTDSNGNIAVAGYVTGDGDLNGDGDTSDEGGEDATGYGDRDIFLSVFNSSGVFQFAKRLGKASGDSGLGVAADSEGNIAVAGFVTGDADLNGDGDSSDGGAEDATGYGSTDLIFSTFNSAGVFQFAKRLGGTDADYGQGITIDNEDNIIVVGRATGDADLNGDGDTADEGEDATGYGDLDVIFAVFEGLVDHTNPTISSFSPTDGATDVAINTNLTLTFDEPVGKSGTGTISLYKSSDDSLVEQIAVTGALVTGSGSTEITINPSENLANSTSYYVQISSNAFPDASGNFYAGISDKTTWNFTTAAESTPQNTSNDEVVAQPNASGGSRGHMQPKIDKAFESLQENKMETTTQKRTTSEDFFSDSRNAGQQQQEANVNGKTHTIRGYTALWLHGKEIVYEDVPAASWFAPYVRFAMEEGVALGYRDAAGNLLGEFGVNNQVTYAEAFKMGMEAANIPLDYTAPQNISARGTWVAAYVRTAELRNLPVMHQHLDVHRPATRGEVIRILLDLWGVSVDSEATQSFEDVSLAHPAAKAIAAAKFHGIVSGDTDSQGNELHTFRPDAPINRAEMAKLITIFLQTLK